MGEREGGRGGRGIGEEQKEVEMSRRGKERNRETRFLEKQQTEHK